MKSALASFATLFSNILANAEDQATSSDIDLLNFVVEIVHSFKQHGGFAKVATQLLNACEIMTHVAREVVRARRQRRPMLDFPSASPVTVAEALEGPPTQFDWNSVISEPPVTSLEQFMSMVPVGDKTSLYPFTENDASRLHEDNQFAGLIPLCFQEISTMDKTYTSISSRPLNHESQVPSPEIRLGDLDNMDLRFPI